MVKCIVDRETKQVLRVLNPGEKPVMPKGSIAVELDLTKADISADIDAAIKGKAVAKREYDTKDMKPKKSSAKK